MTPSSKPQKRHTRSRSIVISDLGTIFGRPQADEQVFSTQDSATIYGGGDRYSCSTPTKAANPRTGGEEQEVESPGRVLTAAEGRCSIIDSPKCSIRIKGKGLIHDDDTPSGFAFIDTRFIPREDELLSTASFNKLLEDEDTSDNDAASVYQVARDTFEPEDDSSIITTSHDASCERLNQ